MCLILPRSMRSWARRRARCGRALIASSAHHLERLAVAGRGRGGMSVVGTLADHRLQANIFVPLCELFHAAFPPAILKVIWAAPLQAASASQLRPQETINQ